MFCYGLLNVISKKTETVKYDICEQNEKIWVFSTMFFIRHVPTRQCWRTLSVLYVRVRSYVFQLYRKQLQKGSSDSGKAFLIFNTLLRQTTLQSFAVQWNYIQQRFNGRGRFYFRYMVSKSPWNTTVVHSMWHLWWGQCLPAENWNSFTNNCFLLSYTKDLYCNVLLI